MKGWMDERIDGWMEKDGWMKGWMDERMDGWMEEDGQATC